LAITNINGYSLKGHCSQHTVKSLTQLRRRRLQK